LRLHALDSEIEQLREESPSENEHVTKAPWHPENATAREGASIQGSRERATAILARRGREEHVRRGE